MRLARLSAAAVPGLSAALFRAPFDCKKRQVGHLNDPRNGVRGYRELVIENGSLIH
jgi:hypothetical protein